MENAIMHVTRYTRPTKMDRMLQHTHWIYKDEQDNDEHYIQISSDEMKPEWIRAGEVVERSLASVYDDLSFITEVVHNYNSSNYKLPTKFKTAEKGPA